LNIFPFLHDFAVVEDVGVRVEHIEAQREAEEDGGRVAVLRVASTTGQQQHKPRDRDEPDAHEPLFSHFHCPGLLPC